MLRELKRLFTAAVLTGVAVLGFLGQAQAGTVHVVITDSGGGTFTQDFVVAGSMNFVVPNGTFVDFTNITGKINNNDTDPTNGQLFFSLDVTRNGARVGTAATLTGTSKESTFPSFGGGGVKYYTESDLSGSKITNRGGYTVTAKSLFNNGNALTESFSQPPNGSASPSGSSTGSFTPPGPTYSIESDVTARLTRTNDEVIVANDSNTFATPEPASMVMAFSGLAIAGMGTWMKRRRARA